MNYDQMLVKRYDLLTKKDDLLRERILRERMGEDIDIQTFYSDQKDIYVDLAELKTKILMTRYKENILYRKRIPLEEFKAWKKAFKHEFLTQARLGIGIKDILDSINELIPNPGINPIYYVRALRENEYFSYLDIEDENSPLLLTNKAHAYLINEANIRLKR